MNARTLTLQPGCPLALDATSGTRLVCVDGLLWLTLEGETEDRVLPAGHSWTARRGGRIVVQALRTGGACAVEPSEEAISNAARVRSWATRLMATRFDPA